MSHGPRTLGRPGKSASLLSQFGHIHTHSTRLESRYSLNYKGIPYKTEWVEYPDIEDLCKKIGAPAIDKKADGRPHYTLPVIFDPSTGLAITDSFLIAQYLDKQYPDTPKLLPQGTEVLQHAFFAAMRPNMDAIWQFSLPKTNSLLNSKSEVYFRRTREKMFGKALEDLFPEGEGREVQWARLRDGYGVIDGWFRYATEGPYVMGKTVTFTDFVLAGYLVWMRTIFGEDSPEWTDIASWHGGRWGALVKSFGQYETMR